MNQQSTDVRRQPVIALSVARRLVFEYYTLMVDQAPLYADVADLPCDPQTLMEACFASQSWLKSSRRGRDEAIDVLELKRAIEEVRKLILCLPGFRTIEPGDRYLVRYLSSLGEIPIELLDAATALHAKVRAEAE